MKGTMKGTIDGRRVDGEIEMEDRYPVLSDLPPPRMPVPSRYRSHDNAPIYDLVADFQRIAEGFEIAHVRSALRALLEEVDLWPDLEYIDPKQSAAGEAGK